jgi:acetoin utilization deacetylase AcuC-like enzyme
LTRVNVAAGSRAHTGGMSARPVAWITHPDCLRHDNAPGHPESADRLRAIHDRLVATGLDGLMRHELAPPATREQLLRVHDPAHVDSLLAAGPMCIDEDTVLGSPATLAAALRAAGACVRGVDLVLEGRAGLAFCAVRPPGHHAERARAMGFCFFNNVAVGAAHALARGLSRIAILDFDVHYGNGTADIFRAEPRVTLLSTYQHPLYPGWVGAPDAPNLVDAPLPAQSGGSLFRAAVADHWLPVLERLRPELMLVSAGFDAHHDDPLGDLRWRAEDYGWIGSVVHELAAECCDGRVVATLEGGYDLNALPRSVERFLRPFLGGELTL